MRKTFAVLLRMASSTLPYGQLPGSTIHGRVTDPHKGCAQSRTPSTVVLYFHGPPRPSSVVYPTKGAPKPTLSNSLFSMPFCAEDSLDNHRLFLENSHRSEINISRLLKRFMCLEISLTFAHA
jgi:hypothetical protein